MAGSLFSAAERRARLVQPPCRRIPQGRRGLLRAPVHLSAGRLPAACPLTALVLRRSIGYRRDLGAHLPSRVGRREPHAGGRPGIRRLGQPVASPGGGARRGVAWRSWNSSGARVSGGKACSEPWWRRRPWRWCSSATPGASSSRTGQRAISSSKAEPSKDRTSCRCWNGPRSPCVRPFCPRVTSWSACRGPPSARPSTFRGGAWMPARR